MELMEITIQGSVLTNVSLKIRNSTGWIRSIICALIYVRLDILQTITQKNVSLLVSQDLMQTIRQEDVSTLVPMTQHCFQQSIV